MQSEISESADTCGESAACSRRRRAPRARMRAMAAWRDGSMPILTGAVPKVSGERVGVERYLVPAARATPSRRHTEEQHA